LRQLQRLTGLDVERFTAALYQHADSHGWNSERLIVNELSRSGAVITRSRRPWPLTEAAKANIAEGELTPGQFDEKAAHCIASLAKCFLQRIDRITVSDAPISDFIPASTLYHVFCAITEAARMFPRRAVVGPVGRLADNSASAFKRLPSAC
jgi:mannose-6-phosphate isomerase